MQHSVGGVLTLYHDLVFHAEDYLLSRALAAHLSRRYDLFMRSVSTGTVPYDVHAHEASIVAHINGGGLRHVEAYASFDGVRTLRALPFVTKANLRTGMRRFMSSQGPTEDRWVKTTTGTTGAPLSIVYDAAFYFEVQLLSARKIAGRAGMSHCVAQRPIFCLAMNDKKDTTGMVLADASHMNLVSVQVHVDERDETSFGKVLDIMAKLRPACLVSKPSVLEQFATIVGVAGLPPASAPMFGISSASTLYTDVRGMVQACLGARVVNAYAVTEFGVVASECEAGQMHVDTTSVYVESVDDDGRPVPEHEVGELVVTGVVNSALPLVRYRTGDLGSLSMRTCACGAAGPCITRLVGKKIACFRLADGAAFSPTFFNDLFARFACLSEFQITQKTLHRYEVIVELKENVLREDCPAQLESLRSYVQSSLRGASDVTIGIGELQANSKFQRYRSEV